MFGTKLLPEVKARRLVELGIRIALYNAQMVANYFLIRHASDGRNRRHRGGSARCRQSGFTLLELAIATAILTFVLGSTIAVTGRGFRYIADMRLAAKSSQILQQEMENLRLMSWSQLQSLPSTFTDPSDTNSTFSGTIAKQTYTSYNSAPTIEEVTLTVTWQNLTGGTVSNSLTSLFSQNGLNSYIQ